MVAATVVSAKPNTTGFKSWIYAEWIATIIRIQIKSTTMCQTQRNMGLTNASVYTSSNGEWDWV